MQVSIDSAVILKATQQTPLLIDPSGQAAAWIVRHESARAAGTADSATATGGTGAVEVITMRHPRFENTLELAVRFGKVRLDWPCCLQCLEARHI